MTPLDIVNTALGSLGELEADGMSDSAKNPSKAIRAYHRVLPQVFRLIPWPAVTHRTPMKNMDDQACPWTASHAYLVGQRVTNDSDKIYRCTTAGISAAAGGPTGTGSATDGTVVWIYEKASTALVNWCHWPLTAYLEGDLVIWDSGNVYVCTLAGTTAAASAPTGFGKDQIDGTVHWSYYTTPVYNRTVMAYQYVLPRDCLRVQKVPKLSASSESEQGVQYTVEGRCLYTDQDESFLKYTRFEEDPDKWDELLQETMALRIASDIALAVTGDKDLAILAYQKLSAAYQSARQIALNEGAEGPPEQTRWEDA